MEGTGGKWGAMRNLSMAAKLTEGDALDVRKVGEETSPGSGVFKLKGFIDGVDYCDAEREAWVWSIGRHLETGDVFAALDTRYYQNPAFVCLWLR